MVNKMPIRSSLNFFLKMIDKKKLETANKIVPEFYLLYTHLYANTLYMYPCKKNEESERERERGFFAPFMYHFSIFGCRFSTSW